MSMIRQTIIVRTDLGFSQGLMAAQVAHIHMEAIRQGFVCHLDPLIKPAVISAQFDNESQAGLFKAWFHSPYVFVHGVPNLEALEYYEKRASDIQGLTLAVWKDTVRISLSENQKIDLSNIKVGISLGPDDSDKIRTIVGDLPLLT